MGASLVRLLPGIFLWTGGGGGGGDQFCNINRLCAFKLSGKISLTMSCQPWPTNCNVIVSFPGLSPSYCHLQYLGLTLPLKTYS